MASTVTVTRRTPTTVSVTVTKTSSDAGMFAVGPGTTWDSIVNNSTYFTTFGNHETGTFYITATGLTPNTQYGTVSGVLGGGDAEISNVADATTPAPAPRSITVSSVADDRAYCNMLVDADGGYLGKKLYCSIDNGDTWNMRFSWSGSSATSADFTSPLHLSPNTLYTMYTRVTTDAGTTDGPTVRFTTSGGPRKKVYGSVNGYAERLVTLYGGSSNGAVRINKLYGSVNGQSKLIYQDFGHLTYT